MLGFSRIIFQGISSIEAFIYMWCVTNISKASWAYWATNILVQDIDWFEKAHWYTNNKLLRFCWKKETIKKDDVVIDKVCIYFDTKYNKLHVLK